MRRGYKTFLSRLAPSLNDDTAISDLSMRASNVEEFFLPNRGMQSAILIARKFSVSSGDAGVSPVFRLPDLSAALASNLFSAKAFAYNFLAACRSDISSGADGVASICNAVLSSIMGQPDKFAHVRMRTECVDQTANEMGHPSSIAYPPRVY